MEPFELTLNQVNFEETDIAPDQKFYSFSNIVSYESDFKKDEHEGIPILPRKFKDFGMNFFLYTFSWSNWIVFLHYNMLWLALNIFIFKRFCFTFMNLFSLRFLSNDDDLH